MPRSINQAIWHWQPAGNHVLLFHYLWSSPAATWSVGSDLALPAHAAHLGSAAAAHLL